MAKYFPNRIDRYIFTEVLGPFLGGNVFFLFILIMFQMLRLAELFITHGVALNRLGRFTSLLALSFIPSTLPVAFLVGLLVGFGRLSADSELVALKASGVSLLRLSAAPAVLAGLVLSLSLALNLEWVPWGERAFKDIILRVSNTRVVSGIKAGSFNSGFFDLLIFADEVDPKTNRLKKVFIYDEREASNPLTVTARSGEVITVRTQKELSSAVVLKLYDGSIHRPGKGANAYQKIDFGEYSLYLSFEEGGGVVGLKPRMLSFDKLKEWMDRSELKTDPLGYRLSRTEFWQRITTAFAPLIFVFLGMGLATVRTRAVRSGAALTAIVVFATYWGLQTVALRLSQGGVLPPVIAMEIPNLVMTISAIVVFVRASW